MGQSMTQLRTIRLRRGLSQTQLAERTGLARPYLSQLETGIKSGSLDTLRRLAKVLGVSTDQLLGPSISEILPSTSIPNLAPLDEVAAHNRR